MISYIRRHLGIKLFISYLAVILVGVIVLASTAEFVVPSAFDRHLAAMSAMMSPMMGDSTTNLELDLFNNFRAAVTEAMILAALASSVVAVLVSLLVSRQVVAPVQEMMLASQRISESFRIQADQQRAGHQQTYPPRLPRDGLAVNLWESPSRLGFKG